MTTLHIINKPLDTNIAENVQATAAKGDDLLLIENGVVAVLLNPDSESVLQSFAKRYNIYALEADAQARGLLTRLPDWVTSVDFDGFVTLTIRHTRTLSWF